MSDHDDFQNCQGCGLPFERDRVYYRPLCEDCERGQLPLFDLLRRQAPGGAA